MSPARYYVGPKACQSTLINWSGEEMIAIFSCVVTLYMTSIQVFKLIYISCFSYLLLFIFALDMGIVKLQSLQRQQGDSSLCNLLTLSTYSRLSFLTISHSSLFLMESMPSILILTIARKFVNMLNDSNKATFVYWSLMGSLYQSS
ncbi:hypothetical protein F4679DRAFT_122497 [Xylaria curta]|nr:hypothetical protein F4679DRAFT_122497 [Xylaria curta]